MELDQKDAKDTKGSMLTSRTTCLVRLTPGARPLDGPATATARLLAALFSDMYRGVSVDVGTMSVRLNTMDEAFNIKVISCSFASLDRFSGGS
jgi:hypothetical protein